MRQLMVQYKVKADQAEENQRLVEEVYKDLIANSPAGIRYMTFKKADGVSFVHIAAIDTEDGSNPLAASAAFQAFQEQITERCEEQPVAVELEEVGAYGFPVRGA